MNLINTKLKIDEFKNVGITGLTNQLISFCVDKIYHDSNRNILIVTNSLYEANIYYSSLSKLNNNVFLFPMDDFLTSEALVISPELKSMRLNTLNEISLSSEKNIIITNLMGYLRYLPSKLTWKSSNIKISKNQEIDKEKLYSKLVNIGYTKENLVTRTGEIANRGYILDIYPITSDNPIRIEFWGEEIESIRYFDIESQRSLKEIDCFEITPFSEFISMKKDENIPNFQKYLPLVNDNVCSIYDYLDDPIIIYKDYNQLLNSYKKLRKEIFEYSKEKKDEYKTNYMFEFNDIYNFKNDNIYLMTIDNVINDISLSKIYNFSSKVPDKFNSNYALLNEYIDKNLFKNKKIIICLSDENKINSIIKFLERPYIITDIENIYENKINIIKLNIDEGFEIDNYIFLSENEIYKARNKITNYKNKFKYGTKIKDINSLKVGDYVVHFNHGIGIYSGMKTLTKSGNKKDYLEVKYSGGDKLYIPAEKIDLLTKFSSNEGRVPKINKLGGVEWQKTKLRIKNKVKDIADKLLKISAERKMKKGFAFNKDDEEQLAFESEFKFTPTPDQLIAIDKIKRDMESPNPMDMLLCGDVGYGKTEVSFRAIFKAIMSGKQVAYLCPTTILSNQQYKSSLERFNNFGVKIALLNRFTTKKDINIILRELEEGKIDLLIGTHRILSSDVKFKDLGLLIIDEEQRFGVTHKEKIKEYKSMIDVLTLSATPIPRTLQMSLVGIRNLALIETPPRDRYPVQTYVVEENMELIREAIYKEMSRGGQVFILFNRVEFIEEKLSEIQRLVPEAKIKYAHGKMTKNQIEDTMIEFINNEFDILLCTTIIETGIDIPNVNTLIIYDADRFGLSQLYQLRGRVGRSNRIAYAYLMYKQNKILNEVAVKRLNAIKEFTELGSGFQIAMRDLSIRGAGDILGSEQAGFIDTIGYDLYVKILNDEIDRLKGIPLKEEITGEEKPLIEVETHIKDEYTTDDSLKIELHKIINNIDSLEAIEKVKNEINDRFGRVDDKLEIYMYSEFFEKLAKKLNITKVKQTNLYVELFFDKELIESVDVQKLFVSSYKISKNFKFNYSENQLSIKLLLGGLDKHFIYYLVELLLKIINN